MKHIKYKFVIDPDVIKKYNIRNIHTIDFDIRIYLNFPDGWVSIHFGRTPGNLEDFPAIGIIKFFILFPLIYFLCT